jgi:hypothetical protein
MMIFDFISAGLTFAAVLFFILSAWSWPTDHMRMGQRPQLFALAAAACALASAVVPILKGWLM